MNILVFGRWWGERDQVSWFSIDNQRWLYGYYLKDTTITDWHYIIWFDADEDVIVRDEIYAESLGQYVGIKDRDGVEIYEGDLIEHDDEMNGTWETYEACEVVYSKDHCGFCFTLDDGNSLQNYRNLLVTGNVFDDFGKEEE